MSTLPEWYRKMIMRRMPASLRRKVRVASNRGRRREMVNYRHEVILAMRSVMGYSFSDIAGLLGMDHTTVMYYCKKRSV